MILDDEQLAEYVSELHLEAVSVSPEIFKGADAAFVTVTLNRTSEEDVPVTLFQSEVGGAKGLPMTIIVPRHSLSASRLIEFSPFSPYNCVYGMFAGWTQRFVYGIVTAPPQVEVRITDIHAVPGGNLICWNGHGRPMFDEFYEGYQIYRSVDGGDFTPISGVAYDVYFLDANVRDGVSYTYRVVMKSKLGADRVAESSPITGIDLPSKAINPEIQDWDQNEILVSLPDTSSTRASFFIDGFRVSGRFPFQDQMLKMTFRRHSLSFGKHELRALIGGLSDPFSVCAQSVTLPVSVECGDIANGSLNVEAIKCGRELTQIQCDLPSNTLSWKCEIFDDKGSLVKQWSAAGSHIKFCIDLEPRLTPRDPKHVFRITRTVQSSGEVLVAFEQEF